MDTELISLISNVGFPIAVAVFFIIDGKKTSKALQELSDKVTTSLDKNSEVLQGLKEEMIKRKK